jgi:hypothetical protein
MRQGLKGARLACGALEGASAWGKAADRAGGVCLTSIHAGAVEPGVALAGEILARIQGFRFRQREGGGCGRGG